MLELLNISKTFASFSLKNVSFKVDKGDFFILLGVSGAGKSLVLETIAGLIKPDSGTIIMEGKNITREKIQKRGIGLVFQDHAVFPHMSVKENIAYSLHATHSGSMIKKEKIERISRQMSITSFLQRRPLSLSGGELQRVALARTLIQEPKILLLDEPLASLDTQLRYELSSILRKLNRNGQTIIHVTHDYEEALSLASKIAVIHNGEILQTGNPQEVFQLPKSEFVAHFTGAKNFFRVEIITGTQGTFAVLDNSVRIRITQEPTGNSGYIMIRAEDIILSLNKVDTSMTNNFEGIVKEIIPSRNGFEIIADAGILFHAFITGESFKHLELVERKKVWIGFKASVVRVIEG
jgi:molybdate/tungstate transport system ATP-binding protein